MRIKGWKTGVLGGLVVAALIVTSAPASASDTWTLTDHHTENVLTAGEGVASQADGTLVYRGGTDIPFALLLSGWSHVGDNDIYDGNVYDAFQGSSSSDEKLFSITSASGERRDYPHPLSSGELYNNSFVTVSPDGSYLVTGTWGTQSELYVLPNPAGEASGTEISTVGTISLTPVLTDVQGCDFVSSTQLVCTTDDDDNHVVAVNLSEALHPGENAATTSNLFVPRKVSSCGTTGFESEGIDYNANTGLLTMEITSPGLCKLTTTVNVYSQS